MKGAAVPSALPQDVAEDESLVAAIRRRVAPLGGVDLELPSRGGLPPCPKCGHTLRVEWRIITTDVAHVAGVAFKMAGKDAPHLICDACGFVEAGKRNPVQQK